MVKIISILLFLVSYSNYAEEPKCTIDNYCISEPFNQSSISRLKGIFDNDEFQGLENLLKIKKIKYKIEPLASCPSTNTCPDFCPENENCEHGIRYKQVIFTVYYDMSDTFNAVSNAFIRNNFDNCSYGKANIPNHIILSKDSVMFRSRLSYATRICLGWLGTHDIASASADAEYKVTLNHVMVDYESMPPYSGSPVTLTHTNVELKGLSGSFLGIPLQLLGMALNFALAPVIDEAIHNLLVSEGENTLNDLSNLARFTEFTNLMKGLKYNSDQLNSITAGFPSISYPYKEETGVYCKSPTDCTFNLAMRYIINYEFTDDNNNENGLPALNDYIKNRLNFILDLRDGPKLNVVKINKRETLGSIAKKEYGSDELYLYLLAFNPTIKNHDKILVGTKVLVPSILCAYRSFYANDMINRSDSLWRRWNKDHKNTSWTAYKRNIPGSKSPNKIYPGQLDVVTTKNQGVLSLCSLK
ncbi:hypothetical protein Q8725_12855 [Klebsiella michiganensis]|uniref:hypothetical protein n=1 Tax=Klebsiella michiganensis TaxID=1134687 RepID=UPI0027387DAE|nr:hypothetical protein [Klebsiella michiganensis]WLP19070.1 hypothetical protein Q8725_12855 [Klebsiella michiganensis]